MNDLPKYLAQDEDNHIVLLAQRLCDPIRELRAHIHADGAMLIRMTEEDKPTKFPLSPSEADAFAVSWLAWRVQQYDTEQAEIRRLQETKERAFAIARECPEIVIADVPPYTDIWTIRLGEELFSFDDGNHCSYGPDELLSNVKSARAEYDKQQQIKVDVEKALSIASKLDMTIEIANNAYYHVQFHANRCPWVERAKLLSTVKAVADQYLQTLLATHPTIHVVKSSDQTPDMPTTWIITRDGHEGECVVQGFAQVLKTVEQYIEAEKVA